MIIQEQPKLLLIGLKHNEFDTYDPEYYDHNNFDYIEEADNEIGKEQDLSSYDLANSFELTFFRGLQGISKIWWKRSANNQRHFGALSQ